MKELRILFTGVGRRIELIQAFRQAALVLNIRLKIYGADMTGTAPALAYCDYSRKVCGMREINYISELARICKEDKIDLVIPTIDTDLLVLSQNVDKFGDTKVLISTPDKIAICRDKNYTADFFESCGCKAPRTINDWALYNDRFPCFIKPKDGSSSINAFKVENKEELEIYAKQIGEYIIQPFVEGTEYTVDAFCDFNSRPVYITPRVRLQVRSGEVLKTQIVMDAKIIEESRQIIERFCPIGPITIQLIRQKESQEDYFIEINPRYGGGAPLSMKAGARSAEVVLDMLLGNKVTYSSQIDDGAIFSRFDQSVCIQEGDCKQGIRGVIFDLDDTLYNEIDYVKSGYKAVADFLGESVAAEKMWEYFKNGKYAINAYLEEVGQSDKRLECIQVYRNHMPSLLLGEKEREVLSELRTQGIKIGIITDGRPEGQRNKIAALGLEDFVDDIIVTDELGGEQFRKPCDIAFRIMQNKWRIPFEQIVYVGDNVNKDFQAPQVLGMKYIYYENVCGLYYSSFQNYEKLTIRSISEICEYLKGKINENIYI